MKKERLEAFSDGMLAIVITIMVLGLRIPRGTSIQALRHRLDGREQLCAAADRALRGRAALRGRGGAREKGELVIPGLDFLGCTAPG